MKIKNKFLKTLLSAKKQNKNTLGILFLLSEKSILVLMVVSILTAIIFFNLLGASIIIWSSAIVGIGIIRLLFAYLYKNNYEYFVYETWYKIFMVATLATAVILGLLPVLGMSTLDDFNQLFIILLLIGLSAGATKTLMLDVRIAVSYLAIMLLPILLNTITYSLYINILLILYILSQVILAIESYTLSLNLENKSKKLFEVKSTLLERENLLYHFFEEAPGAIFQYDTNLKLVNYNPNFATLFKRTKNAEPLDLSTLPNTHIVEIIKASLTEGSQHYNGEYVTILGDRLWVDVVLFPFRDSKGKVLGGIGIVKDETKEHNALEKLEYLSIHDTLTGLLNRRGYAEYINRIVKDAKHSEYYSVLLYIDLNDFKSINDTLGHEVGDHVLLQTAKRLTSLVPDGCMVSRLGGDEFIVLIPYISKIKDNLEKMVSLHVKNIQESFLEVYQIQNTHLHIKASIGIVIIEPLFDNIEEILRHADMSMYQAKHTKEGISYYNAQMDRKQKEQFQLQNTLAKAAYNNQLKLFLQPIVNIDDSSLYAAELLLRWEYPKKGVLSPNEFIDIAIKAGYLSEITWWIIKNVFKQISQWKSNNQWKLEYISININAQQLIEKDFASKFIENLSMYHLKPQDIVIEITERSLIENFEHTQNTIQYLHQEGIRFAIDDFGTGYSSLSYLKRLSFDILKIDREFIKDIESNPKELLLVSTIVDIGKQFNYNIVIEGIEDKKQKDLLFGLDEDLKLQGYYFAKPMDMHTFEQRYLMRV